MKNTRNKVHSVLQILVVFFGAIVFAISSQVFAQDAAALRIKQLEEHLQSMQTGMQAMQSELEKLKSQSTQVTQKIERIEHKESSVETNQEGSKRNMVFFRGGFAHSSQHRNGLVFQSDVVPAGVQDQPDKNAWYFGAGFDWNLTRDAWGLAPKTSVLAELMIEYKEFSSHVKGNALANMPTQLVGGAQNPHSVTVSQLSIYAAPKIKFMEGSRLRPWIIPAGFGMHIISPPGESASFFIPGVVFGGGLEYRVWKDFYAGIDARYHITGGKKDGIDVDGVTAGGYLGIGF